MSASSSGGAISSGMVDATVVPRQRRQSASGRTGAAETLLAIHTNGSPSPSPRSSASSKITLAVTPVTDGMASKRGPTSASASESASESASAPARSPVAASAPKACSLSASSKNGKPSIAERRLKAKGANLLKAPAHIQINVTKEASLVLGQSSPGVDNLLGSPTFRTALNTPGITQTMLDEALKSPLLQRKMGALVKHHLSTGVVGGTNAGTSAGAVNESAVQFSALPALTPLMQSGDFAAKIAEAFKSPLPFAQMGGGGTTSGGPMLPGMNDGTGQTNITLNSDAAVSDPAAITGAGKPVSRNADGSAASELDNGPNSSDSHTSHTLPLPISTMPSGAQHSRHNDLFSEFKTDIDISAAAAKAKTLIAEHHQYVQKRHLDSLSAVMPQSAGLGRAFGAGVGSTSSSFGYDAGAGTAGAGEGPEQQMQMQMQVQMYPSHLQQHPPPSPQLLQTYVYQQPPQQHYVTMQQQQFMQQHKQMQFHQQLQMQHLQQPPQHRMQSEAAVPKQVPMYEHGSLKVQPKAARVKCVKVAEDEGMKICKLPDGTFECPTCGKISKRKSDHIKHQRTHSKSKPYECTYPQCSARFSDPSTRSRHIKAHDPAARINCAFPGCGKEYSRQANMIRHLMTHNGYEEYMPQGE